MVRACVFLLLTPVLFCAEPKYEIQGAISPPVAATIALHSVKDPFRAEALAGDSGRFRMKNIPAGSYTVLVWAPGKGEAQRTIDVGPAQADSRNRVDLKLEFDESDFEFSDSARTANTVSLTQLRIPDKAINEYQKAQAEFSKGNFEAGIKRIERSVEIAPRYAAAWNDLGAIRYKMGEYEKAEECFRRSLDADRDLYTPLVNLGGVLINLGRFKEALTYNQRAVAVRPADALANAQLGQAYLQLGQPDNAMKYLEIAVKLDPGHFSNPQLFLAQIYARRGDRAHAVDELEGFLKVHPDYARANEVRAAIASLRR